LVLLELWGRFRRGTPAVTISVELSGDHLPFDRVELPPEFLEFCIQIAEFATERSDFVGLGLDRPFNVDRSRFDFAAAFIGRASTNPGE